MRNAADTTATFTASTFYPRTMLRFWLMACLTLSVGSLTTCNLKSPPSAEFKHQNDKQFDGEIAALMAENISMDSESSTVNDTTRMYLNLLILNAAKAPTAPDSIKRLARKLAHLLVADLKNPEQYDAVRVRIQTDHEYIVASTTRAQNFEFSIAEFQQGGTKKRP